MKFDWILDDAFFGRLKDSCLDEETIKEFIENHVYSLPTSDQSVLLRNFSDLYILVAKLYSHPYVRKEEGEGKWNDILSKKQYKLLKKTGSYIVGYIYIDSSDELNKSIHFIELIDTRVKCYNLAYFMITRYEKIFERILLLPREITDSSVLYWKKYFDRCCDVCDIETLDSYLSICEITRKDVKWGLLFDSLSSYEDNRYHSKGEMRDNRGLLPFTRQDEEKIIIKVRKHGYDNIKHY